MRDGYYARWRGTEYEASPDGESMRLYTADAAAVGRGFAEVAPGRLRRLVPMPEIDGFAYVRTVCTWRDEPFVVVDERDDRLRLEYTGGRAPVAHQLGLETVERGVYQAWIRTDEVSELHEEQI